MMRCLGVVGLALATAAVVAAAIGATPAAAASRQYDLTCTSFMRDYGQNLPGLRVSFERPLTITKDLLGGDDGVDVHILSTDVDVEGTLKCKGDEFRRFEVRIDAPTTDSQEATYGQFQRAALLTVFHWDRAKVDTVAAAMTADAREYLRASIERGDTYNAGKVEYHEAARYDLGLIWTKGDHTFVIASQSEP